MKRFVRKTDDRGIALVSVMIALMLCLLLSATIMRVSYLSLLSRNIDTVSADTFYTAESVVDDIRLNLQQASAAALSVSGANDAGAFVQSMYAIITTGTDSSLTPEQNAAKFISKNIAPGATVAINGKVEKQSDALVITDVYIEYIDPDTGFQSNITTDIRIRAPYFASSESHPLASYSMFAGGGANVGNGGGTNANQWGNLEQQGNVYIGYMNYDPITKVAKACVVDGYMNFTLSGDNIVINGDLYITNHSTLTFLGKNADIRGKIYISENSHLVIGTNTNINAQDIIVEGKSVRGGQYINGGTKTYNNGKPQECATTGRRDYVDASSSVVFFDGTTCRDAECVTGAAGSIFADSDAIKLLGAHEELLPHPNIEYDGKKYDERFAEVIDLEYFIGFCKDTSRSMYKEPKKKLGNTAYSEASDKYIPSAAANEQAEHNRIYLNDTKTNSIQVQVAIGSNIPVNNGSNSFVISTQGYMVEMNGSSNDYYGIYMSTQHVNFRHTGNNKVGYGRSLFELDNTDDDKYVRAYLNSLGQHVYTEGHELMNQSKPENYVINNYFVGGIKSLYSDTGNNSNEGDKDFSENQELELIGLENWNKK